MTKSIYLRIILILFLTVLSITPAFVYAAEANKLNAEAGQSIGDINAGGDVTIEQKIRYITQNNIDKATLNKLIANNLIEPVYRMLKEFDKRLATLVETNKSQQDTISSQQSTISHLVKEITRLKPKSSN